MATTRRQKRVGDLLRDELAYLLLLEVRDPRLAGISVTEVRVSADLSYARIYVSFLGHEDEKAAAEAALDRACGYLRRQIAQRVRLRRVPEFSFRFDDAFERGQRILDILDHIEYHAEGDTSDAEETDA